MLSVSQLTDFYIFITLHENLAPLHIDSFMSGLCSVYIPAWGGNKKSLECKHALVYKFVCFKLNSFLLSLQSQ